MKNSREKEEEEVVVPPDALAIDKEKVPPLMRAAQEGDSKTVELLLAKHADPNLLDAKGCSALMRAAFYGRANVVEILIAKRADPKLAYLNSITPLMFAAARGQVKALEALLSHEVMPHLDLAHPISKKTALIYALENRHIPALEFLLTSRANPNLRYIHKRESRIEANPLLAAASSNDVDAINVLLAAKADPNLSVSDVYRLTPLHSAAANGHATALRALLVGGDDLNSLIGSSVKLFVEHGLRTLESKAPDRSIMEYSPEYQKYKECLDILAEVKTRPDALKRFPIQLRAKTVLPWYIFTSLQIVALFPKEINHLIAAYAAPMLLGLQVDVNIDEILDSRHAHHYLQIFSSLEEYVARYPQFRSFVDSLSFYNGQYYPPFVINQIEECLQGKKQGPVVSAELHSILTKIQINLLQLMGNPFVSVVSDKSQPIIDAAQSLSKQDYARFHLIWHSTPIILNTVTIREFFTTNSSYLKGFMSYLDQHYYKILSSSGKTQEVQMQYLNIIEKFIVDLSLTPPNKAALYKIAANSETAKYRKHVPSLFSSLAPTAIMDKFLKLAEDAKESKSHLAAITQAALATKEIMTQLNSVIDDPAHALVCIQPGEFSIKIYDKKAVEQFIEKITATVKKNTSHLMLEYVENTYPTFTQIILKNLTLDNLSDLISRLKEKPKIPGQTLFAPLLMPTLVADEKAEKIMQEIHQAMLLLATPDNEAYQQYLSRLKKYEGLKRVFTPPEMSELSTILDEVTNLIRVFTIPR